MVQVGKLNSIKYVVASKGFQKLTLHFFYYYYNFYYCINVNVHVCLYAIIINVTLLAQSVEVMRVHGTY